MVGDDSLFYKEGNKWKQAHEKKRGVAVNALLLAGASTGKLCLVAYYLMMSRYKR